MLSIWKQNQLNRSTNFSQANVLLRPIGLIERRNKNGNSRNRTKLTLKPEETLLKVNEPANNDTVDFDFFQVTQALADKSWKTRKRNVSKGLENRLESMLS